DYVRKYGTEAFNELALHGRETVFAFKMRYHRQERNLNNEKEQLAYVDDLLIEFAKVPSLIQQDRYLTQIATEFHISRDVLQ
ncbi:DNA primase, partial [Streptococcus pyogenes]